MPQITEVLRAKLRFRALFAELSTMLCRRLRWLEALRPCGAAPAGAHYSGGGGTARRNGLITS